MMGGWEMGGRSVRPDRGQHSGLVPRVQPHASETPRRVHADTHHSEMKLDLCSAVGHDVGMLGLVVYSGHSAGVGRAATRVSPGGGQGEAHCATIFPPTPLSPEGLPRGSVHNQLWTTFYGIAGR